MFTDDFLKSRLTSCGSKKPFDDRFSKYFICLIDIQQNTSTKLAYNLLGWESKFLKNQNVETSVVEIPF